MTAPRESKAAARAAFEAKYPKVERPARKVPARIVQQDPPRVAPEPIPAERREPRLLGAPRNGGHRFNLEDNYRPAAGSVDEWDRRAQAFRSTP
jgi:hypothetical protein